MVFPREVTDSRRGRAPQRSAESCPGRGALSHASVRGMHGDGVLIEKKTHLRFASVMIDFLYVTCGGERI